jgi:site-specific recombinase XerD
LRSISPAAPVLGDALLQAFARSLGDQDLSPVTVRDYLHDLHRFRIWIEQRRGRRREILLGRLTTVQLVNYRQHLLGVERLKATTINRKIQALKKLLGWARQKGHLKLDVAGAVQFVRVEKRLRPRGLTEAEIQALLRAAGQTGHGLAKRNYALLEVLLETGLRVGEVAALRIGDLTMHSRSGVVRVREGKGRKQREVPLNSPVRRALQLYFKDREKRDEDYVFLSERGGKPLSLRTMQATVSELARRARIMRIPVSPHTMRHSFALRYLKHNPGKLVELATLLGHESLDTTAVYTRPSPAELAADLERSGARKERGFR